MDKGEAASPSKRTERVKSIFDSDDSDDNSDKGFSPSKDEDDDDDLRKQIDEVCFNLSNEEEKLNLGVAQSFQDADTNQKEKVKDLNILTPTFTMEDVRGANRTTSLLAEVSTAEEKADLLPSSEEDIAETLTCASNDDDMGGIERQHTDTDLINTPIVNEDDEGEGLDKNTLGKKYELMESEYAEESGSDGTDDLTQYILKEDDSRPIEESKGKPELDISTGATILKDDDDDEVEAMECSNEIDSEKSNIEETENAPSEETFDSYKLEPFMSEKEEIECVQKDNETLQLTDSPRIVEEDRNVEFMEDNDTENIEKVESESSHSEFSKLTANDDTDTSGAKYDDEMEIVTERNVELSKEELIEDKYLKAATLESMSIEDIPLEGENETLKSKVTEDENEVIEDETLVVENEAFKRKLAEDESLMNENEALKNKVVEDESLEVEKVTLKGNDSLFDQLRDTDHPNITAGTIDKTKEQKMISSPTELSSEKLSVADKDESSALNQVEDLPSKLTHDSVLQDLNFEDEKLDVDKEEVTASSYNEDDKEKKERDNALLKSPNKEAELANLNDVWNTVNIFQGPKLDPVSEEHVEIENTGTPEKAPSTGFHESDNDSGTDMNDKVTVTENKQSLQDSAEKKELVMEEDMDTDELTTHMTKEMTSSPWEAMKNGSLFEDVQMLQDQSPEYLSAENLRRKKVRVEDIFTDSEGEDSERHLQKLKLLSSQGLPEPAKEEIATVKKTRRRRERATSINLPAIMLAFEKGWIREVVYRSSSGIGSKKADIYYYSPDQHKLRSRVELEEYLEKNNVTDLSMQNFTFFKEPLGVETKYELIRQATSLPKIDKSDLGGAQIPLAPLAQEIVSAKPLPKKRVRKPTTKVQDQPPAKKAKTKEAVKKVMIKDALGKGSPTQPKKRFVPQSCKPYCNYSIPSTDSAVYATHLYPANPPLTQARIITPVIRGEAKDRTFHCTATCEAGGGNVPNLQCVKCVCLFHPECCQMPPQTVSIILSAIAKFLCPNCYREENIDRTSFESHFSPAPCFEPLAFDPASESEDEGMVSDYEHPSFKRFTGRPPTPDLTPLSPMDSASKFSSIRSSNLNLPLLPQTQSSIPPSALYPQPTQQVPQIIPNLPLAVPLPPSSTIGPNSFLIYQPITSKCQNLSQPMYLPGGAAPPSSVGYNMQSPAQMPPTIISQNLAAPPPKKVPPPKKPSPEVVPSEPKVAPGVRGGEHFLKEMASSYLLVRRIFSYLSLSDLMQVSRVCLMWRDVAFNHSFWNCVRLKNICVNDWDKMVEFFDRRGTAGIDLRNMVIRPGMLYQRRKSLKYGDGTQNESIENSIVDQTVKESEQVMEDDVGGSEMKEKSESPNKKHVENKEDEVNEEKATEGGVVENVKKDERESSKETKEFSKEVEAYDVEKMEVDVVKDETEEANAKKEEKELEEKRLEKERTEEEARKEAKAKKNEKELEEKRLEKERKEKLSYIVSSVLSEHDYFGRPRTTSSSSSESDSSSSCSSSSASSDAGDVPADTSEIDVEGATNAVENLVPEEDLEKTDPKVEDEVPPLGGGTMEEEATKPRLSEVIDLPVAELPGCKPTSGPAEEVQTSEVVFSPRRSERKAKEGVKGQGLREKGHSPRESRRISETLKDEERELTEEESIIREWRIIASALGKMRSLRKLIIGTVNPSVAETILLKCHQLTSFSSINLGCQAEDTISFDPSFLMQTRDLEELRLTSQKRLTFKSNFNFIKLPHLKVLMLKGLKTTDIGWPYMGTQLTRLHLSSVSTFSHNNWLNISSMTGLVELELDGGGSDHDSELCLALTKLSNLSRLTLLDWNIGSKLPYTLRKLHNIKYLHVVPACESQAMKGIYAGRLMVVLEAAKHLVEFTWGIQAQSISADESSGDKVYILNMKGGKETGTIEGEEVRSIAIDSLKGFIKCRIPNTKITVRRVSSNPMTWISSDWQ